MHVRGFIEKSKEYLNSGENPPKGVPVHTGPNQGKFYNTEDVQKPSNIDDSLKTLGNAFKNAGFQLYAVGGMVRDELLGKQSKDCDLTTNAPPEKTKQLIESSGVGKVYSLSSEKAGSAEKYGTVALSTSAGEKVEITTFRAKEKYEGGHKPTSLEWGKTIEEDLSRRDFTFNAMAKDVLTGKIIDPFGGAKDLKEKRLRAVGNSKDRFNEDPLRMLRAVRFAARFGIKDVDVEMPQPERLKDISKERINEELTKILTSPNPKYGVELMRKFGLMKYVVPELEATYDVAQNKAHYADVFNHTLGVVENCSKYNYQGEDKKVFMLAAMLHDVGKPKSKTGEGQYTHFYNHHEIGEEMVKDILKDLHYDNATTERVSKLVKNHMRPHLSEVNSRTVNRMVRDLGDSDAKMLIDLAEADAGASNKPESERFKQYREIMQNTSLPANKITSPISGKEIMEKFNIPAGKPIGEVKEFLTNKVMDGELKIDDKDSAYSMAEQFIKEKGLKKSFDKKVEVVGDKVEEIKPAGKIGGDKIYTTDNKMKYGFIGMNKPASRAVKVDTNINNNDIIISENNPSTMKRTLKHELIEKPLMEEKDIPYQEAHKIALENEGGKMSKRVEGIIQKSKKYLKEGQNPPKGRAVMTGSKGGKYYETSAKSGKQEPQPIEARAVESEIKEYKTFGKDLTGFCYNLYNKWEQDLKDYSNKDINSETNLRMKDSVHIFGLVRKALGRNPEGNHKSLFMATEGEKVHGLALTKPYGNGIEIEYLVTAPSIVAEKKRKGVGTTLVYKIVNQAREAGAEQIVLKPTIYAAGFYEKLGFKENEDDMRIMELEGKNIDKFLSKFENKKVIKAEMFAPYEFGEYDMSGIFKLEDLYTPLIAGAGFKSAEGGQGINRDFRMYSNVKPAASDYKIPYGKVGEIGNVLSNVPRRKGIIENERDGGSKVDKCIHEKINVKPDINKFSPIGMAANIVGNLAGKKATEKYNQVADARNQQAVEVNKALPALAPLAIGAAKTAGINLGTNVAKRGISEGWNIAAGNAPTAKSMDKNEELFPGEEIQVGMKEEMEHSDITNGDPELTRKIVDAHLKEDPHYYSKLMQIGLIKKAGAGMGQDPVKATVDNANNNAVTQANTQLTKPGQSNAPLPVQKADMETDNEFYKGTEKAPFEKVDQRELNEGYNQYTDKDEEEYYEEFKEPREGKIGRGKENKMKYDNVNNINNNNEVKNNTIEQKMDDPKEIKQRLLGNIQHFLEKYEEDNKMNKKEKNELYTIKKNIENLITKEADAQCKLCGYRTFSSNALKDNKGRLSCPQCREPYSQEIPVPVRRFKFNTTPNSNAAPNTITTTMSPVSPETDTISQKSYQPVSKDMQMFLKGYESLAYLGNDLDDGRLFEIFKKAVQVNEDKGLGIIMNNEDRIAKIISIDKVAHALHMEKFGDGTSQYKILDDLAGMSKSLGEKERDTRLIIMNNPSAAKDIEKLMKIEILQKSGLERSSKFWKLLEKAIRIGVKQLNNYELVALREWLYAKM